MVNISTVYSDDPSSSPTGFYIFSVTGTKRQKQPKMGRAGPMSLRVAFFQKNPA